MASQAEIQAEWDAKQDAWLVSKTKSVLADTTVEVIANKFNSRDPVLIKMHVKAIELNYGPCIHFRVRVDNAFTQSMDWDDHPFLGATKDSDKHEPENSKGVVEVGDIVDDTPAVRAMIAELVQKGERNLYVGTDCTHRARLISCIRMFWS
jgi:hypothetical protein